MQTVTIEVDEEGAVKVSVEGVAGRGCVDLTRAVERALGQTTKRAETAAYYQQEARQSVRAGGGRA